MPAGRPLGSINHANRSEKLKQLLWDECRRDNYSRVQRMCSQILKRAADGDLAAATFVMDRIVGRPMVDLPAIEGDGTLVVSWVMQTASDDGRANTIASSRQVVIDHDDGRANTLEPASQAPPAEASPMPALDGPPPAA
jgi:hypothetical protein